MGKKHSRSDGDDAVRSAKKAKTDAVDQVPEADLSADKKKAKKDKTDKKEKKDKKDKKKKTDDAEDQVMPDADAAPETTETTETTTTTETESEPKADKKDKKEKKDKKDKKDKKEKKSKKSKSSDESPAEPAEQKGAASPKSATPSAATPASRTGATYMYAQSAALTALPEAEIDEFLKKQEIAITDPSGTSLRPILAFSHLPASKLTGKKPYGAFTAPTPIQSASWPFTLSGRDVIGIAETGSGKTHAFALPCVEALLSSPRENRKRDRTTRPRAVIVSPTRELAMQTHESVDKLCGLVGLSAVCIYGGASKDEQRSLLQRSNGADIVVATPGRLKDFLSDNTISLEDVMFAVLDEADRMLDKGFEEDIRLILGSSRPREKRQTVMFTATWPQSVRGLAEGFMVDPVRVTIGNRTRAGGEGEGNGATELQANLRIEQKVEVVDPRGKEQRLLEILKENTRGAAKNDRILVFCLYKKEAVRVEQFLERRGIHVASIHGDLRQDQRTRSLEAFKSGTTSVLVATDVAARGLDIPEVKLVVNCTVSRLLFWVLRPGWLTRSAVPPDHRGLRPPHRPYRPRRQAGQGHHSLYRAR